MEVIVTPAVEQYAEAHSSPEPAHFAELAAETRELSSEPQMMVGTLEGRLLKMLVAMVQPRRVLEIGLFTGYSALSMAEALPEGGSITSLEISSKHETIARRSIARTPYGDRIDIRMGPALETLKTLEGPFDFVFIDADKSNYRNYYEAVLPMLSPQGVIAVDNTLWYGRILDPADTSEDTVAIREFNDFVARDERVECVVLTVRDGVTLVRKR